MLEIVKLLSNNCQGLDQRGAPVAQWVKRWPTDLADRVRFPLDAKSSQSETEFHCAQPFIINLTSSWYDWNTVEKGVKSQVIHPSILDQRSKNDLNLLYLQISIYSLEQLYLPIFRP